MPLVSVLMPCYNAADTLPEALQSLSAQTWHDFEVIAVDDGSTDATPLVLRDWARKERRLRLLSQPHQGIIAALNAGLEQCQGQYIARMDADDRAHPERLERQTAFLEGHPEISVVSCRVTVFPSDQVRAGFRLYVEWLNGLLSDEEIRRQIFIESPLPHPSLLLRKEALLSVGGYQEHGWPEDYDLLLRLYLAGARFAKLEEYLLEWREHPQRLTRQDRRYSLENFLRAKAHYLCRGPLQGCDGVILWGAGMIGRRLGRLLLRQGAPLAAYVDIDPRKIGSTRHRLPILAPEVLPGLLGKYHRPVVLAAVGARGARPLIRQRLNALGLREGGDWWCVA